MTPNEIIREISRLTYGQPMIETARLAFLVSPEEWEALWKHVHVATFREPLPLPKPGTLFILGVKIIKNEM